MNPRKLLGISFLVFPLAFVFTISISLIIGTFFLLNSNNRRSKENSPELYSLFASKPKTLGTTSEHIESQDSTSEVIRQFMIKYNTPQELINRADKFVEEARIHGISPWLTVSIGMCEGNLGKATPKFEGEETYNTWGWAASEADLAQQTGTYDLHSWDNAIETVIKGLATSPLYKPYTNKENITFEDIENIMRFYAPLSIIKGGPWAKCVWQYYQELATFKSTF